MKHYEIYINGEKVALIRAKGHTEAEAKALKLYPKHSLMEISVSYTEI